MYYVDVNVFQLSGVLYRKDLLGIQSWLHVPRPISKMADYSLGRLFHTPCPIDLMSPIGATLEIQRLQHIERLEQQMMWAQLTRQAAPAQVTTIRQRASVGWNSNFHYFGNNQKI